MSQYITINRRSQLGFAWTNNPEQWFDGRGQLHLRVADPGNEPTVTGYLSKVLPEYESVARLNNANYWRKRWFVKFDGEWVPVEADVLDLQSLADKGVDSLDVYVIELASVDENERHAADLGQ